VLAASAENQVPAQVTDGLADRVEHVTVAGHSRLTVLVRPDAYVAWAAGVPPGDGRSAAIRAALAGWCLPATRAARQPAAPLRKKLLGRLPRPPAVARGGALPSSGRSPAQRRVAGS
jgi:aromatic ring hydroxylase-like protein